jgi:hypothetical protein
VTSNPIESRPRSRRALMAGALGGLAAWAAAAAVRVNPAEAAAGDPIRMGRFNKAGGTATTLQTSDPEPALRVVQLGSGHAVKAEAEGGRAVEGRSGLDGVGVFGYSPNNNAVQARTVSGYALNGWSTSGAGLYAASSSAGHAAIFGGRVRLVLDEDFVEMNPEPGAPDANAARVFARDNGLGKTQLCVRFATGAVQVIATEP